MMKMKKKILILIITIFTIINVFSAAFLFFDLFALNAPETTVTIEITDINSIEAIVETTIEMYNSNNYEIIVKDLKLITKAADGKKVAEMEIDGGSISSNEKKTFIRSFGVKFNGDNPEKLETTISGNIGIKSGFIEKTIPISINIVTNLGDIITNLALPTASIHLDFGEIDQECINITMLAEMYNPNDFDIGIEDIEITMTTESGESVGNFDLEGGVLSSNSYLNLNGSGIVTIQTLNAESVIMNMSANVSGKIAGFTKSLPFNIVATIGVPDLKELLPSKLPTEVVLRLDSRVALKGLIADITLETHNPNRIDLVAKDINFAIYRVDRDSRRIIGECGIDEGVIKSEDITILSGELVIPYTKLFIPLPGEKIIPDWLEVVVTANVTIKGLNNYIWVGVIGQQDFHPFRIDKVYTSTEIVYED